MMKTIREQAAQGDLYIRRVASLPRDAREVPATNGRHVVAHSETGHHHLVTHGPGISFYEHKDPLVAYLRNDSLAVIELMHAREFDTHETIGLPPGIYEIRRQREFTPDGWKRAVD